MKVLLIEDDNATARSIKLALQPEGIVCDIAETGGQGLEMAKFCYYDLLLLDLMLPDIDGFEVLLRLRSAKIRVPILILSGLSHTEQKIKGLGLGADDYLTKPFDRGELIARIQAIARRSKGHVESVLRFDKLYIDLDTRIVKIDDNIVHLTGTEYAVLETLAVQRETVVTKEALMNSLYQHKQGNPESKIVDVFVCKLRRKLYEASGGKNYIETVWGSGYTFATEQSTQKHLKESLKYEKVG